MTNKQAMTKIKSMMKENRAMLLYECERLLRSGALNVEGANNDYYIPRVVIHVAMLNIANQYAHPEDNADVKNLKHF